MATAAHLIITIIFIVGCYQFYFHAQRAPARQVRELSTTLDDAIPFRPQWVWVYSFLFYPILIAVVFLANDSREFVFLIFSFAMVLLAQLACFHVFPVQTPLRWRDFTPQCRASRFLHLVQSMDGPGASFPSMHVSVSTLAALHLAAGLQPALGTLALAAYGFPVLIGMSAVYTKQHYLIDLPFGAALGYGCYRAWLLIF
ncbi:MAG: phosphatase PAP2 family protein [Rhodospirillaceae bacterium]